ncbi:hypothetical protein NIES4071_109500 (plasmid) [Calothrix sp. NIES-4071]|nr:hypothetical protein NIES4071_109500 [Calothrix sp. NIES-4071]BAZ65217.1 hypothetical protein NIES4105_109500 [Calothrix sp. NIES-4105]
MPTSEQLKKYFDLTIYLTKMYVPINLGTLDPRTGNVAILAGQEIVIEIYPNGRWRFLNE